MTGPKWLFPPRCALCSRLDVGSFCPECASLVDALSIEESTIGPKPLRLSVGGFRYTDRAAQAVRRLKYARVLTHVDVMCHQLLRLAERHELTECDAFVPVPIHWTRRCERGFNQAEVLCEQLPHVDPSLLRRVRRTRQQVGLTADLRARNLLGAFSASSRSQGKWLVLVDDVTTSGGTARECAKALLDAGALQVDLLTYCSGGAIGDL